jgi:hypothetical protein
MEKKYSIVDARPSGAVATGSCPNSHLVAEAKLVDVARTRPGACLDQVGSWALGRVRRGATLVRASFHRRRDPDWSAVSSIRNSLSPSSRLGLFSVSQQLVDYV